MGGDGEEKSKAGGERIEGLVGLVRLADRIVFQVVVRYCAGLPR